jgi:S1-C subfamily serine protease
MFQQACSTVRESVYGIRCDTKVGTGGVCSNGTAFMISPGVVVTAAHVIHKEGNFNNPIHQLFGVIRAPDVGQKLEIAQLIAEDADRDLALLRITNPRSTQSLALATNTIQIGTSCGSLGFPLAKVDSSGFHLFIRFQGAFVSSFNADLTPSGRVLSFYETDALMYQGSSGCPGFLANGTVFGLHNRSITENPQPQQQTMGETRQQRRQRLRHELKQQAKHPTTGQRQTDRFAISIWIPSTDIITFAHSNGVTI